MASGGDSLGKALDRLAQAQEDMHPSIDGALTAIRIDQWPHHDLTTLIQAIQSIDDTSEVPDERRIVLMKEASLLFEKLGEVEGRRGEHLTPAFVAKLMVAMSNPQDRERILDPWCRAGEILVPAAAHLITLLGAMSRGTSIKGYTRSRYAWELTNMNLAIHDVEAQLDLSSNYLSSDLAGNDKYDVVLANPPFNFPFPADPVQLAQYRWRYGTPPEGNANFAWLQFIISSLHEGGRAAVLMPSGAASSQKAKERSIRARMIEEGAVECIVALPSHLFASTPIPVALWLLRCPTGAPEEVLVIDATAIGRMVTGSRRILTEEDITKIVQLHTSWRQQEPLQAAGDVTFASVSIERIRDQQYALNPLRYVPLSTSIILESEAARLAVQNLQREISELHANASEVDKQAELQMVRVTQWIP
jgi:type I restriction enzyme M protein